MRAQNQITVYGERNRQPYTGFVYIWKNTKSGKFYIGSHMGYLNDGYAGSGAHFKNAFTKDRSHFRRKILEFVCGDYKKLLEREDFWLSLCSKKKHKYYNSSFKATGLHPYSCDSLRAMSNSKKNRKWYTNGSEDFLLQPTDDRVNVLTLGRSKTMNRQLGANRNSIWITNGGEEKKIFSLEHIPDGWELGRKLKIKENAKQFIHSQNSKEKIKQANVGVKKTQETRLKLSKSKQGRQWYTNGNETKLSFSSPGVGWREGRK